jgi:crossover junction endonuclease MUS81
MLMNIKGIGAEKAMEIQKHFPTIRALTDALAQVDETQGRALVSERCCKYGRKKIGPALSAKIHEVFRGQSLPSMTSRKL